MRVRRYRGGQAGPRGLARRVSLARPRGLWVPGRTWSRGGTWLPAVCGIAGPLLFTAAWTVSSLRQPGHAVTEVQLSGLAAIDARDPQIMIAGFAGLGACSIAFGAGLGRLVTLGSSGPRLVICGGAAAVAAGLLRRDHMLLTGPGFAGESWHNQAHDVISGIAYAAMLAAPLLLARRFRDAPDWAAMSRPVQALTLISAGALAIFATRALEPWNGTIQRVAVTLPLATEVLVAARMLTLFLRSGARGRACPADPWRHRPAPPAFTEISQARHSDPLDE